MSDLTNFERMALNALLMGDDTRLAVLREQARRLTIQRRETFFTHFDLPDDVPVISGQPDFVMGDVYVELEEQQTEMGVLLFVRYGKIDYLECYSFEVEWPESRTVKRFYYVEPTSSTHTTELRETNTRNMQFAFDTEWRPPEDGQKQDMAATSEQEGGMFADDQGRIIIGALNKVPNSKGGREQGSG